MCKGTNLYLCGGMKRTIVLLGGLLVMMAACEPVVEDGRYVGQEVTFARSLKPSVLTDYVINLGTYTAEDIDEQAALAAIAAENDLWPAAGGCSCASALVDGELIFGRNMDLSMSPMPAYVFKTRSGKYETLNLEYFFTFGPRFDALGSAPVLDDRTMRMIPYFSSDVMNDQGLYMECNMRDDEGGRFACSGTNPGGVRVFAISLGQYVASRCASVSEAVELIRELDVYTGNGPVKENNWTVAWMIGDASGNCALVEFADNQVSVMDDMYLQTNFFATPEFYNLETFRTGVGRFDYLRDGVVDVRSENDMEMLLRSIMYSKMFTMSASANPYVVYDVRSEWSHAFKVNDRGEFDEAGGSKQNCTYSWLMADCNKAVVDSLMKAHATHSLTSDPTEMRERSRLWSSSFHLVANCARKSITVCFFEDLSSPYTLHF